jgi:hypothetical protein
MFQRFLDVVDYWFRPPTPPAPKATIRHVSASRSALATWSMGRTRWGLAMEKTPGLGDELCLRSGTYKIKCEDGRVVTNAWNIEHLRPFYP